MTLNGNEITFGYETNFGDNTNVVTIEATIAGEAMNGTMSIGQFGSFPIEAKKISDGKAVTVIATSGFVH